MNGELTNVAGSDWAIMMMFVERRFWNSVRILLRLGPGWQKPTKSIFATWDILVAHIFLNAGVG